MHQAEARTRAGRLSPAMIVAVIALIASLTGSAWAVNNKRGNAKRTRLSKSSVGPRQLKAKAVRTGKIANNAINGRKVRNNSLTGADINLAQLGVVPAAVSAIGAGNANTVTGHAAACPFGTILIRGVCFDASSNGPAADLKSASDACAARGGYLPAPMQLFSVRGVINLGTGVGDDQQFTDVVYADDGGGQYWTVTVDGTGALERQQISNASRYICVYPLVR